MNCSIDEWFVVALARTVRDREVVFHGFASPCAQVAMHVARRTHAPDCLLGCHFLGVAAKMPGEDCDPILDRNPDAGGINVRLAIERVDDGAPEPLVVHHLSPILGKTCRWRRA